VTGSGTVTFATTLATVNANVGTWNNVTVNGKGQVTAGSNVAYVTGGPYLPLTGGTLSGGGEVMSTGAKGPELIRAESGRCFPVVGRVFDRIKMAENSAPLGD
jgi:uncharacterized protein with beta-barrel porin domain